MSRSKDEGPAKEWFKQYPFDRWQRLRRHPDYRSFCRKYKEQFEEIDHVLVMFSMVSDDTGDDAPLLKIKEQFKLSTVYHYDCDFSPSDLLNIRSIFRDDLAVNPQCSFGKIDGKSTMLSFVKDEHYVDCRINIDPDIPLQEIKEGIASFVKLARSELGQKDKRLMFDNNMVAYKIYDLRLDRAPFKDISRELGTNELTAQKSFSRGWELIHGREYKKGELILMIQQKLAEQGRWSELQRIEPPCKEAQVCAYKIDNYHVGDKSVENEVFYRKAIQEAKAYCQDCPDITCSREMTAAFDYWLNSGTPNFDKTSPCPKLYDKILE